MEDNQQFQKRQVAFKTTINQINSGKYIKEEGWNPNYLLLDNGTKVSRVNIIATIIDKQFSKDITYQSISVDDGSGNISLRSFDDDKIIESLNIGDSILLIARPREFGNQIYLTPEIIKKIDNKEWVVLRKLELAKSFHMNKENLINSKIQNKNTDIKVYKVNEDVIVNENDVLYLTKKLDNGDGADINQVIEGSKSKEAEKIINNMIKTGELFEIKPGRIKILE